MLDFQRLGKLTAELSSNLVQSIVLPRRGQARPEGGPAGRRVPKTAAMGRFVLAPDLLTDDQVLALIRLAGGRDIRISVVPAAAEDYQEAGEVNGRPFRRYGITRVEVLEIVTRERADSPFWAEKVIESDVVVLTDGEAGRAKGIIHGTMVESALREVLRRDKIVVGCGAGGSLLGKVMVETGPPVGPAAGPVYAAAEGCGFLPGMVIVQDLLDPSAITAIVDVLASNPARLMGIGLDRAALAMTGDVAQVIGNGVVTVIDSRGAEVPAFRAADGPQAISGLRLHRLVSGQYLNLATGQPDGWTSPGAEKGVVGSM